MGAIAAAVTALILAVNLASVLQSQTEIDTEVLPASYSFGEHITFYLNADSADSIINEVNLFFRIQGQPDTVVMTAPVEPAPSVSVALPYESVAEHVPPFSMITYWWEIVAENGARQLTDEQSLYYADNRYAWRPVRDERDGTSWEVFYADGDAAFGQMALDTALRAQDEIVQQLGAAVPGVIRMFVYPSESELRSALSLAGYDWAGGQARPELGVILVGIPDDASAQGEMERKIPHELTHLLVYEATGRARENVPPWLNEGLASVNEFRSDPDRQVLLEQALAEDRLYPLEALCAPFPTDAAAARLAYAQSASVVEYLREEYGSQVIRDLLAAYVDAPSCEAGVDQVLGRDLEDLDASWRSYLREQGWVSNDPHEGAIWLVLWLMSALLALPLLGVWRSRRARNTE